MSRNAIKIKFSPLLVGVMNWGVWGKNYNTAQMKLLINQCVDSGLTSFDHAAIYGAYTTEAAFGAAFTQTGLSRGAVQFISKCGIQYPSENSTFRIKHYDYSAQEIIRSAEQSLTNLQTDYLDLLLFHRPSPLMHMDEVLEALTKLMESGKVLSFGVSNFEPPKMDLIRSVVPLSCNQIEFSLTHHEPLTNGQLDYLQTHDIQPMAWKPLGTIFSAPENNPDLLDVLSGLSANYSCSLDVLLLAWILKHPSKIVPVIGTTSIERIRNQSTATSIQLTLEDWFQMYTTSLGYKVP